VEGLATVEQIGLTHKDIYEGRLIRDAEVAEPGIVRRTLSVPRARVPGRFLCRVPV
jgi:hypothetical protein